MVPEATARECCVSRGKLPQLTFFLLLATSTALGRGSDDDFGDGLLDAPTAATTMMAVATKRVATPVI
jgi:hypothetical protein